MSDFDVSAVQERHQPYEAEGDPLSGTICGDCGQPWPCDAVNLLDVIREFEPVEPLIVIQDGREVDLFDGETYYRKRASSQSREGR